MNNVLQQLQAWFTALDAARRQRLLVAVAVAIVAAVGLSWWASQETWAPLLSGRGYDAALTAAAALDEAGVSYRITAPDVLEVPEGVLGKARAAMATDGNVPGLSDVSELKVGLTPQAQQWAFLRAAEGSLARTINNIEGIDASEVHLVPRQASLYLGDDRPATASVLVKLRPGGQLGNEKVEAIVNLVASAVDGLDPDRVTVADDRGNLLASGEARDEDSLEKNVSSLLDYRGRLEDRYERAVSQSLLPVLGYGGGFSVTATVDVDATSRQITTRQVDTEKQAVVSEVNEEDQQARSSPNGVPGVDANLPDVANAAGAGSDDKSARTSATLNYMYPTVDEVAHKPAGGVQRVSVAVQVDAARIAAVVAASNGKLDEAAVQAQIEAAVRAAIGFDEKRSDVVAVNVLPFAPADWTEGTEDVARSAAVETALDFAPYAVAALALLLVFTYVVRPLMNNVIVKPAEVAKQAEEDEKRVAAERMLKQEEDLAGRLRLLVDNYQPVDAGDLNKLVQRESVGAAEVVRKWNRTAR